MDTELKFFKCSGCQYILATSQSGYAAPCPMCKGYMFQVDEQDKGVQVFLSVRRGNV